MCSRQLNMKSAAINEKLLKANQKTLKLEARVRHHEEILEMSQKKVKTKDLLIGKLESSLEFKDKTLKNVLSPMMDCIPNQLYSSIYLD